MAERKIVAVAAVLFVVVVGALVPVATADACTVECYKECEKGKKDDVPSCTKTCDGMCRLKAATREYASATPAQKAAMVEIFKKQAASASSAAAASTPGFASLKAGCLHECNNGSVCREGKKACSAKCEKLCRVEAEGLTEAATTYTNSPDTEKKAVIQAIDKHASGPSDKVDALAATCIGECSKFCGKDDSACVGICNNGCRARAVIDTFSMATPAQKEVIKKDIQSATGKAGNPVGTA